MKRSFFILITVLLLAIGTHSAAYAQLATADLSITTIPLEPQPLQPVQVRLQSFGFSLDQATIVWKYNGTTVASGTGRTSISVTAPANGKVATLTATATSTDFNESVVSLILRPASVDVLWEGADSYTPAFYKGRALPSNNGIIRVTAIPSITAPRELSYTWSKNDSVVQGSSGYAKSSMLFKNETLDTIENISVSASSASFSGTGSASITPRTPNFIGYFNNEGYIDYANGSATALTTTAPGSIIRFEPFFFSTPYSVDHDLTFTYTDNDGNAIEVGSIPNELRLSRPEEGGESQLTLAIHTVLYSLQNITKRFTVNFN